MRLIGKISQVALIIGILIVIWLVISGIRGCQKTVKDIIAPISEKIDPIWGKPKEMITKSRFFGTGDKPTLEITIPPSQDTIRLKIPGGERVYGLPENVQLQVVKIPPPIIRFKPTFHLTGIIDLPVRCTQTGFSKIHFGLKIRVIEIWRFGLCGYVAMCGPGVGCDFQVISNISIGVVRTMDKWNAEVSIKL